MRTITDQRLRDLARTANASRNALLAQPDLIDLDTPSRNPYWLQGFRDACTGLQSILTGHNAPEIPTDLTTTAMPQTTTTHNVQGDPTCANTGTSTTRGATSTAPTANGPATPYYSTTPPLLNTSATG